LPQRLEGANVHSGVWMKKEINVIVEKDEDGFYVANVPALKRRNTQAKSLDILMESINEAVELCLKVKSIKT